MASDNFELSNLTPLTLNRLLSFVTEDGGARIHLHKDVQPISQQGPQCGLVALAMSLRKFGVNVSVDQLMEKAIESGFTNKGEMFSIVNLCTLANFFAAGRATVIPYPSESEFQKELLEGAQFILAYDCEKNFGPGLLDGISAHWLLVCGFVYKDSTADNLMIADKVIDNAPDFSLLGYQGKSKSLGVFDFSQLLASNQQLMRTDKGMPEFILKDPNDLSELRNQVIKIF